VNVKLGDFKNKIQILEKSSTKDSLGSPVTVPSVLKTCWAHQLEVSASEDEDDGKIRALFDASFIVKYDARLVKGKAIGMYVKDDEDILYNIENAIEIEHRKFLRINASKDE
tara:strand:+ start:137 stop:472 length:336 start_codon:yes stop_codon:yes gene_type:complete